jgi:hypothetical protein
VHFSFLEVIFINKRRPPNRIGNFFEWFIIVRVRYHFEAFLGFKGLLASKNSLKNTYQNLEPYTSGRSSAILRAQPWGFNLDIQLW